MPLADYLRTMPKVELHVHLEGSIQQATLLQLARRHQISLPADTVDGVREWYRFTDFDHFVEVYLTISKCVQTADDIELIAREFLVGQAEQNIRYTEVTYTAFTHYVQKQLPFDQQLSALNRARAWGAAEFGVHMGVVIDIPRVIEAKHGDMIADWVISAFGDGVVGFGLGGPEVGHPPEKFAAAFDRAHAAGVPSVPHAGETAGPASIWGALKALHAVRIGHGVRCLEDPKLVEELRTRQTPLEVCPTSNVCLGVAPTLDRHPLPRLVSEGLYVTINSDDPPMFNTTLNDEYVRVAEEFGFDYAQMEQFVMNAVRATLLPPDARQRLEAECTAEFKGLREQSA